MLARLIKKRTSKTSLDCLTNLLLALRQVELLWLQLAEVSVLYNLRLRRFCAFLTNLRILLSSVVVAVVV